MDIVLERFSYSNEGTFGYWKQPDGSTLATVERPWLKNFLNVSCIPVGSYTCKPRFYNRGGYDAYEICDVPGRTHILIHVANFVHEVEGCIGLNSYLGCHNNQVRGWASKRAFDSFMELADGKDFNLHIVNREGGKL